MRCPQWPHDFEPIALGFRLTNHQTMNADRNRSGRQRPLTADWAESSDIGDALSAVAARLRAHRVRLPPDKPPDHECNQSEWTSRKSKSPSMTITSGKPMVRIGRSVSNFCKLGAPLLPHFRRPKASAFRMNFSRISHARDFREIFHP